MDKKDILHAFEINNWCGIFTSTSNLDYMTWVYLLFPRILFSKLLSYIFLNCGNKDNYISSTVECRTGFMAQGQKGLLIIEYRI